MTACGLHDGARLLDVACLEYHEEATKRALPAGLPSPVTPACMQSLQSLHGMSQTDWPRLLSSIDDCGQWMHHDAVVTRQLVTDSSPAK